VAIWRGFQMAIGNLRCLRLLRIELSRIKDGQQNDG
jgi:hypothetical protein